MEKYFLSLLAILFVFFASCNKGEIESATSNFNINEQYYVHLGELHNEGLDYVLDKLNSTTVTKLKSSSNIELQAVIIDASIEFIKEKETVDPLLQEQIVKVYEKTLDYIGRDKNLVATLKNLSEGLTEDDIRRSYYKQFGDITDRQLEYIKKIEGVYDNKNTSVSKMVASLMVIRNEVVANLTEAEAHPVLTGIYAAIYSLNYWKNNAYKWQMKLMDFEEMDIEEIIKNSELKSTLEVQPIKLEEYAALPEGWYPWPGVSNYAIYVDEYHICHILKAPEGLVFDPNVALFVPEGTSGFDWSSVSQADWVGGVSGATGGAITGSVAGGVGAVPGFGIGFIAGSIGTSSADAIKQLVFD